MTHANARFVVAPQHSVRTPLGKLIPEATPVSVADFHGGEKTAWELLRDLVLKGLVLEADITKSKEKSL